MSNSLFLPLSPSHSAAEMEHMIADSHADVVVGNIGRERLPDMDNKPIFISTTEGVVIFLPISYFNWLSRLTGVDFSCGNRGARRQNELHPGEHRQESLIIYTSGTTGKPKVLRLFCLFSTFFMLYVGRSAHTLFFRKQYS